jgi:hypothetical protein
MKQFIKSIMAVGAVAGSAMSLQALPAPTLTLSDGIPADTVTVTDNGVGDASSVPGIIVFNGAVGNWTINVTTGQASPPFAGLPGTATAPDLDLNSFDFFAGGAGNVLTITLTEFGVGPTTAIASTSSGGTIAQGITGIAVNNLVNGAVVAGASSSTSPFNLSFNYALAQPGTYNWGLQYVITANAGTFGTFSGDSGTTVPDGGMTVSLLGMALLGLEGLRRKLTK